MFKKIITITAICLSAENLAFHFDGVDKVVYGEDDRVEYYQESDPLKQELARSTAVMIHKRYLVEEENGFKIRFSRTLGKRQNLCEGEKFSDQQAIGNCTGFLIGKDEMATAGHCYPPARQESICEDYVWVFDYKLDHEDELELTSFSKDQVYHCKQVKMSIYEGDKDAALIQLDRATDREPLKFSKEEAQTDQEIFVIGYPFGIPMKISSNAKTFNVSERFFSTNLDTFKGNSGSPVFDERSGDVLGILVRGKADFYRTEEGCFKVNTCDEDRSNCESEPFEIDGEQVTKISYLSEIMKSE